MSSRVFLISIATAVCVCSCREGYLVKHWYLAFAEAVSKEATFG